MQVYSGAQEYETSFLNLVFKKNKANKNALKQSLRY